MEGISLGSAFLRLYGDRSALDRELAVLKRYTDQLEKQGIKVKFDADTGQASREVDQLKNKLNSLNDILRTVGQGLQGDSGAWAGLQQALSGVTGGAGGAGGAMGRFGGALSGAAGMASRVLPVLGQLGLAAQGLQAIFFGVSTAVNSVLGPLQQLSQEAGRFNQQVAEAGIFTSQSFAILGPDGKALEGTANQMRAVRGVITKEYQEIQKEVAKISGATASEIYEGFNLILQNSSALGKDGEDLGKIRKLSTRLAAGMNVLNIPGQQLRSEVSSLFTGDIQMYDQLPKKLGYDRATVEKLKAEGRFYDDLMQKLEKLYQGQEVLSNSLANVKSNFDDLNQSISSEGGQALERGLAQGMKSVLDVFTNLKDSFMMFVRGTNEMLEPLLKMLGDIGGMFVSIGAAISSVLAIVMDLAAVVTNLIGFALGPTLSGIGKVLQIIAKVIELIAKAIGGMLRPLSGLLRVATDIAKDSGLLRFFDWLLKQLGKAGESLDEFNSKLAETGRQAARRMGEANARDKARAFDSEGGVLITPFERQLIKQAGDVAVASYNLTVGENEEPDLRALNLNDSTKKLLEERSARLGSGSTRRLNEAKELSQLVQDRVKNEIQGLEQALKLMGAQKSLQQAMNDLAESRRGLESNRANFAIQVAASPEARLAAEENRNDLAARQEQERINERRALLGTEREMLQMQLQIQLKQQKLQQEQLRIQRLELQIQKEKAQAAIADIQSRMQVLRASSPEFKSLARQRTEAQSELRLRSQQLEIIDRTVELGNEMVGVIQQTNALEGRTLDIKGQQLGIQEQLAGATREQQAVLAELQRQEQAITAERDRQLEAGKELIRKGESQIRNIEEQQKANRELEQLDRARAELKQNQANAAAQEAEALLKVAQAQQQATESPTSVQAVIGARIEALAVGAQGFVSEAEATRKVYEARQRQLQQEQELQRKQLQIQQDRERAELELVALRMQVETQRAINTRIELQSQQQLLQLQQRRDEISASVAAAVGSAGQGPVGAVQRLPGSITGRLDASGQNGADMPVGPNNSILSYHNGVVTEINRAGNNGNYTVVEFVDDLGNKLEATYSHMAAIVEVGQRVIGGQVLGRFDGSGRTSGAHNSVDINSPGTNGALQRNQETPAARRSADILVTGRVQGQVSSPSVAAPSAPILPAASSSVNPKLLNYMQAARAAGFTGQDLILMTAVGMAESSGNPGAIRNRPDTGDLSYGAWQINMIGDLGPQRRQQFALPNNEALLDLNTNARVAKSIFDSQGIAAWGSYTDGRYRQYMAQAQAAANTPSTTSLQNSIDSNANLQRENNEALRRSTEAIERLNSETLPRLVETQTLQRDALATSQRTRQEDLRIQAVRDRLTAEVLKTPRGRLAGQLTEATAGSLGNTMRGLLGQLFSSEGFDLAGLTESITRTMAERFTGALLEAALAPIEKQLTENLFRTFSGVDLDSAAREQMRAADIQLEAARTQERAASTPTPPAAAAGQPGAFGVPYAIAQVPFGESEAMTGVPSFEQIWGATGGPALVPLAESAAGLSQSMDAAGQTIDVVATTAGRTAGGFEGLMQSLGRVGAVLGGIAMGVGGAQQMGKGGTYNVLMGLAGIFGSIGSIAGMFAGRGGGGGGGSALAGFTAPDLGLGAQFGITGGFGGFRAYGGTATSNLAYLTGERGRELFVPRANGTIIPNDKTEALLQARSALGGGSAGGGASAAAFQASREAVAAVASVAREQRAAQALSVAMAAPGHPIKIETQVINAFEFATVDQLQQATAQAEQRGAQRGQALALGALKNSVKTRRSVGMG